jgi:DNA replicative helicase MCM subunit Mcm2 (Cdc46/Mcm family)
MDVEKSLRAIKKENRSLKMDMELQIEKYEALSNDLKKLEELSSSVNPSKHLEQELTQLKNLLASTETKLLEKITTESKLVKENTELKSQLLKIQQKVKNLTKTREEESIAAETLNCTLSVQS